MLWQFETVVADISQRLHLDDTSARLVALDHIDEMIDSLSAFEKRLELTGVGYRAALKGKTFFQRPRARPSHCRNVRPPHSGAFSDRPGHPGKTRSVNRMRRIANT